MNLLGWSVLPDDCVVEFKFEAGPKWLRILAHTPYFERFAYPAAVKRGLGILRCKKSNQNERELLESLGWVIQTREKTNEEKFFEGSLALMTSGPKRRQRSHIAFTRWGRQVASWKSVHKSNGTYSHFKNRTLPPGLGSSTSSHWRFEEGLEQHGL